MVIYDPVSAMLSTIKNGYNKKLISVKCRKSKFIINILKILYKEGYINGYKYITNKSSNNINFNSKKKFFLILNNEKSFKKINDKFKLIYIKFKKYSNLNSDIFFFKNYNRRKVKQLKSYYSIKILKFKKIQFELLKKIKRNKFKQFRQIHSKKLKKKKIKYNTQRKIFNQYFNNKYYKSKLQYNFKHIPIYKDLNLNINSITSNYYYNVNNNKLLINKKKKYFIKKYPKFNTPLIEIFLKYNNNKSVIKNIKKISKLSRRIYLPINKINNTNTFTTFILSTSKGILSINEAKKLNIGGEVLIKIN